MDIVDQEASGWQNEKPLIVELVSSLRQNKDEHRVIQASKFIDVLKRRGLLNDLCAEILEREGL